MSDSKTHEREVDFHDHWAQATPANDVLVREGFEAPTAMENQFIFARMGELRGKRLLDIGAGLGESAVFFALQGAEVTVIDISPGMIEKAKEVGRLHGVVIEGRAVAGEELPVETGSFDIVYIANTIHHVQDKRKLLGEMHRVLRPGGRFFSYDPIAYNPAINVYRGMANKVRTEDEGPLRRSDVALAREFFPNVETRMFWLATLALFAKYYFVDRIHPNQDRYWKRILRETPGGLWWWMPLLWLDRALTRLPGVRWWCWNVVMWGTKPAALAQTSK